MLMILLLYKEAYFNFDDLNSCVLSVAKVLLQKSKDIFHKESPSGLPPIQKIEHQIDLVLEASIPNQLTYKSNPEETKKLQRQVKELMSKE